jgi:hypothetical protein
MANKKFWMGILAITLIFGMMVVGCDNGEINKVSVSEVDKPTVTDKVIVGGVMLSWPPVIGASEYEVWRDGGGQPAAMKLSSTSTPNRYGMYEYFDIVNFPNELKPNTKYTYTVIAIPLSGAKNIGKWEKKITTNTFPDPGSKAAKPADVSMEISLANRSFKIKVTPPVTGDIPNLYKIVLSKDSSSFGDINLSYYSNPAVPFELTLYGDEYGSTTARQVYQMLNAPGSFTVKVTGSLGNNTYFQEADEITITKSATAVSIDDYTNIEPPMARNANRAVVRINGTALITRPASLPATGNATFSIYEGDGTYATIVSQDGSSCTVRGGKLGSARIVVTVGSQSAIVVVSVSPSESSYTLPANAARRLGDYTSWDNGVDGRPSELPSDYANYIAEPTTQLAYCFKNHGIDFLAYYVDPRNSSRRGWVGTTYSNGGWRYDLNGVNSQMTDGVQTNGNVKLELKPEFVYDNGIPYLQITHKLTNTGSARVTGQKFGASADIMLYGNDQAPLTYLNYGALMTDRIESPSIKFRFVCQNLQGVDDVSTLWLGTYGSEREHVYDDRRENISGVDSAMNFSYQNIELNAGASKTFIVRFTQIQ